VRKTGIVLFDNVAGATTISDDDFEPAAVRKLEDIVKIYHLYESIHQAETFLLFREPRADE
jgi:hypothetical protein